jgi:SAM-dependent methyltransferase
MAAFYGQISRYYDVENEAFTADLPLYVELAEEVGDPILEIGCGSGRVLLHLAQAGYNVTGLDPSEEMLNLARRKLKSLPHIEDRVQLLSKKVEEFDGGKFPLILLTYNMLMHFTRQEAQIEVLQNLREHLTDDGLIVIHMPNAGERYTFEDEENLVLERMFVMPDTNNLVMQQSIRSIDRVAQKLTVSWIYDEVTQDNILRRTVASQELRYIFPAEMKLLLQVCGLKAEKWYGDFEGSEFADGCEEMIVLARKL